LQGVLASFFKICQFFDKLLPGRRIYRPSAKGLVAAAGIATAVIALASAGVSKIAAASAEE